MMQDEYPEARFLEKALESPEFRAFYAQYRESIPWRIHWVVNPDVLDPRVHGCTDHYHGECGIVLRSLPSTSLGVHVLAHELGHLVLDAEGFPGTVPLVRAGSPEAPLSALLSSSLQDPIIEGRLGSFGFPTVQKYKRWTQDALEDMLAARAKLGEDLPFELRTQRLLLVLKHRLWWKAIAPGEADVYFWKEVESGFPALAKEARSLAAVIEGVGYSDPDSMAAAMNELRRALELKGIVSEPKPRP